LKADFIISLDVGGTFVKGCVMENYEIIDGTIRQFAAKSDQDKETILANFVNIILSLFENYKNEKLKKEETEVEPFKQKKRIGIGLAFPGPFDYKRGISYIRGLNKYDALYGVSVYEELTERLKDTEISDAAEEITILFENDARLFGLGASTLYPMERLICLTIGTGLGSVFIENGKMITEDERVPREGYLYNQLFQGVPVDDYFSRRGILQSAAAENLLEGNEDVKELANAAREGNKKALKIFRRFGSELGEMLIPHIERFKPDKIIIGGQIAKSFDLFGPSLSERLKPTGTNAVPLEDALRFTHLGIAKLFDSREK